MVRLQSDGELPRGVFRRGAHLTGGTRTTGGPVKTDAHDGIAGRIPARRPFDTGVPLGTARLLCLPIDAKSLKAIALSDLVLPTAGPKRGPHHIDLVLTLRRDQEIGIHVAAVEE